MRLTPQQKIATAFITAAGISVVIGLLAYLNASRMHAAALLVVNKQQTIGALEAIFPVDTDLLTAERDYILGGNQAYITAYRKAIASGVAAIRRARQVTADNPSEQSRVDLVGSLFGELEKFTGRIMRIRHVRGIPPAAQLVLSGTGESLQHAISANVAAIIAQEHRHLAAQQLQMTRASDTALYFILAGSGLAILIALVAGLRIRADFRAVQQAEERFRALMDSAPDAIVVVDKMGKIVLVNTRTEALLDYKRQELIGKPIETLIPTRYRTPHTAHRGVYGQAPVMRPMGAHAELFARRRDGSEIPVEVRLSPVATFGGPQVASAIRDISDRKRALEQLRAAHAAAEKADRAKSVFLATASHDLRQPLQTISLLNGTLRRICKEPDPAQALLQQEAAIGVMSHLLSALLDISKLESGAVKPVLTNWQISALLEELRGEFAKVAAEKKVHLEVESSPVWVHSDLSLVGQMLRNLVANAVKYTHRGTVRLRARAEGETVRVEVSDTGIGMAAQELDHIHEEFYQIGVPTNATREGYGLGLSIVNRIAKLLNLKLDIHSELGVGSTFALTLPVGTASVESIVHTDPETVAERSARNVRRILVVDDDPAVLNATRLLLTAEGYGVATASSGAQALERVRESADLELLISDYHLAERETGRQLIASVRQLRGPEFKAVLITGDTSTAARGVQRHENIHFLSKPVNPDELLRLIEELLSTRAPLAERA